MQSPLVWLEIDLRAIDANIKAVKRLLKPDVKLLAVVKSNAYGHGMVPIAAQAVKRGIDILGTFVPQEIIDLRKAGIVAPIFHLGAVSQDEALKLVRLKNVEFNVFNEYFLKLFTKVARILGKKIRVHIKVDTGLHRLGFSPSQAFNLIKKLKKSSSLQVVGLLTHLASVEELNRTFTTQQLLTFDKLVKKLERAGLGLEYYHTAASAAINMHPESHYNLVRLGIEMYGLWPSRGVEIWTKKTRHTGNFKLKEALSFRTRLVHIGNIPTGGYVGYGCSFQTKCPVRLGVIPVGYAEGFDRKLSNLGFVLLKGKIVPVVGRVCMNMTILDLSKVRGAKVGEVVTLIGKDKNKTITAQDIGDWAGTINYEIVTRLPAHLPRIYLR